MTTIAAAVRFDRPENSSLGQPGKTVEYKDEHGHTLAYLDYSEDGQTARCNVFDPSTSRSRQYEWRPVARAAQIVANHLNRLGYAADENPRDLNAEDAQQELQDVMASTQQLLDSPLPAVIPDLADVHAAVAELQHEGHQDAVRWLRDVAAPAPEQGAWDSPAVRAAVAETIAAEQPAADPEPAPEFADVADAADAILGAPEDEIIRHWRDVRGTVWQFHLRSICPPAETAAALRSFVADVNSSAARGGRTMNSERRFYCWGPEGWNVGYAIILPA